MTYMGIERRVGSDRRTETTTVLPGAVSSGRSASSREYDARMMQMRDHARPMSVVAPGLLMGFGLGGILDGIVFRRLLDWHHVLSGETAMTGTGITDNMRADGIFDIVAFALLIIGIGVHWATAARRRRQVGDGVAERATERVGTHLAGWMLLGWAGYIVVEGLLFHAILGWHHVKETAGASEAGWDWLLIALGVLIGLIGLAMTRARDDFDDGLGARARRAEGSRRSTGPQLPDRPPSL